MSVMTCADIIDRFPAELAGVVAAMSDVPTTSAAGTDAPGVGYLVTVVASEGGEGALKIHIDRDGAGRLAQRILASSGAPSEPEVIDALRDVCLRAASAVVERRRLGRPRVVVESVESLSSTPAGAGPALAEIRCQDEPTAVRLALWGTLVIGDAPQPAPQLHAARPATASPLATSIDSPDVDVILDMELPLVVRFGRTEMTLKSLASLAPGAVIDLGRSPDDPVEVLVSNKVVARGEVVTVGGSYGVRITDIISPAERARHMEVMA
jgi:flagellar motor switch protein FliN